MIFVSYWSWSHSCVHLLTLALFPTDFIRFSVKINDSFNFCFQCSYLFFFKCNEWNFQYNGEQYRGRQTSLSCSHSQEFPAKQWVLKHLVCCNTTWCIRQNNIVSIFLFWDSGKISTTCLLYFITYNWKYSACWDMNYGLSLSQLYVEKLFWILHHFYLSIILHIYIQWNHIYSQYLQKVSDYYTKEFLYKIILNSLIAWIIYQS